MEDRGRILDELTKNRNYKIALFTSFNFDIEYFERAILSRLYDNGIRKISLFIDNDEFDKALNNLGDVNTYINLGKKYIVSPVSIKGAFHPKMILLLGEKKAKLIVSSANIKASGYENNNEVYNVFDYSEKNSEYQSIIVDAIKYFNQINNISYKLDESLLNECLDLAYYSKCKKINDRIFIGNINLSILNQLKDIIPQSVNEIKIAVPYYDNGIVALNELKSFYSDSIINLYVQQGSSTFPEYYAKSYNLYLFDKFKDNNTASFYHGKVLLFKTNEKDYILYGSANCTVSALINTYITGGNVECDILDIGECGEFDEYFENLNIIDDVDLISNTIVYNEPNQKLFRFLFAETSKEGIYCHFNGKESVKVDFSVGDKTFTYNEAGGEYIVFIDKEELDNINMVFDMNIRNAEMEETVRCWIIDKAAITSNRRDSSNVFDIENFDIDSSEDKFREDRINLLNAELMCVEELNNYKKIKAVLNQQKILDEEENDQDNEDFIVDSELHYEYKSVFRRYSYVERIRGLFIQRFLHPSHFIDDEKLNKKINSEQDVYHNDSVVITRKATTEEKRFERFVKSRIKGILNPQYVDIISFEHYLGMILAVNDIFKRYNNNENVIDVFTTDYVVKTKVDLINLLLLKKYDELENKEEYEEHIIVWTLCVILENHLLISNHYNGEDAYKLDSIDRELLKKIEKKYNVRSNLQSLIKKVYDPTFNCDYAIINDYGASRAIEYLDGLYGYKDNNKLYDFIKSRYGKETIITIEKKNLCLDLVSYNIIDDLLPNTDVIREVSSNIRNTKSDIKKLVIRIKNGNDEKSSHIDSVKHTISLDIYRRWDQVIYYSDGRKEVKPGRTINFN